MLALTFGEIEKNTNSLLCVVCNDNGEILQKQPLGMIFILELQATENEDECNQFAEKIKRDLQAGIGFIERLQIPVGSNGKH